MNNQTCASAAGPANQATPRERAGLTGGLCDDCALRFVFESRGDIETFDGLALGTYPVIVCWEDEDWWIEVQESGDPS